MPTPIVLFVSHQISADVLQQPPFGLAPEQFLTCTYESLGYLGLGRFCAVVLHEPPVDCLQKLALGIRDTRELENLWDVLHVARGKPVKILVPAPCRPLQAWLDLGIEPITPRDLTALAGEAPRTPQGPMTAGGGNSPLTADDIRDLHRQNIRFIPADRPMTSWAREVADSLGIVIGEKSAVWKIVEVKAGTPRGLLALSEKLHHWAHADSQVLFLLPSPLWPVFNERFASLRGRLVAGSVCWADKGAFTGEVSLDMVLDMRCRGVLLPDVAPYNKPEYRRKTAERAAKHGLLVFALNSLEQNFPCDIMATPHGVASGTAKLVPLTDTRGNPAAKTGPNAGAILVSEKEMTLGNV
jgi:hypothetical protein